MSYQSSKTVSLIITACITGGMVGVVMGTMGFPFISTIGVCFVSGIVIGWNWDTWFKLLVLRFGK